jgi:hypothetical protein
MHTSFVVLAGKEVVEIALWLLWGYSGLFFIITFRCCAISATLCWLDDLVML